MMGVMNKTEIVLVRCLCDLSEYEIYVRDNAGKILRTETYNASGDLTQTATFG